MDQFSMHRLTEHEIIQLLDELTRQSILSQQSVVDERTWKQRKRAENHYTQIIDLLWSNNISLTYNKGDYSPSLKRRSFEGLDTQRV